MSLFGNTTEEKIEQEVDTLGGGGLLDTGVYDFTIKSAFAGESAGGAKNLTLELVTQDGKTLRKTVYTSSAKAKGQKSYYEKDGKKFALPGFSQMRAVSLLTIGKELSELVAENKVIKLYDYESKKELPTEVPMIVELLGEQISMGVIKQIVDKNEKNSEGKYVPNGETREENEIDKIFRTKDSLTVAEVTAQSETAEFRTKWEEKWNGQVRDRSKKVRDPSLGTEGATGGAAAKPAKSLFN